MTELDHVSRLVAAHMDQILSYFKPGKKITVLVRSPDNPEGDFTFNVPLAQGDVVVFWPYEDYGAFSVWVDADGKYRTDAFFPALANNFYVHGDWDAYGTFGELIESDSFADALKSDPKPTICIGQSFPGVSFRFDIDSDGNPRFVRQAWVN